MRKLVLRGMAERKLRSALTGIAVLLGVAMISGTYIETDQIRTAFDDITAESVKKLDVVVTPKEEFTASFASELPTLPEETVGQVEAVPGVAGAEGEVAALGNLVVDGEVVETQGAPGLVMADSDDRFDPSEVVEGRDPEAPFEATVFEGNAEDNGIEIGDRIGVTTRQGEKQVIVTGLIRFGEGGSSLGGTTGIELPREQVQEWFDLQGKVTTVSVIADPGVSPEALAERVDSVLPEGAKVQTASENAEESADEINDQIGSFLTPALLALAGAAVLVGAFIIFNTFSITVAQRTKEFALLRALGTTRRQILAAVTGEALVIGVLASALGLGAGILISKLLNSLFDAAGFGIPRSDLVLESRTIVVALAIGIGITLLSSLVPAVRATRVPPVTAMADVSPAPSRRARRIFAVLSVLAIAVGGLLAAQGLFGSGPASAKLGAIASGAILIFVGVALSARYLVRPLASVIGWPLERVFRTTGRLARENAERNPGRTAITSAALMVGLGLVVFVAVFASALKTSIGRQVDELVKAELLVYSEGFTAFSARTEGIVEEVDGVKAVQGFPYDQLEVNGEKSNAATDVLIGIDPEKITEVYTFDWIDGDDSLLAGLGPGEALIEEQFAKTHDLEVGDSYEVVTPSGGRGRLTAIGEYRDPTIIQGSMSTRETLASVSPARDPISLMIALDDSADEAVVEKELERVLEPFPAIKVENKSEYKRILDEQLNQIVYMLYALLAMSVVISLFGIANSLFLSIHERTREFGTLRAVGTTGSQIRRMVRYESVITSTIGGVLGIVIGIAFAWLVVESLSEFGFSISIPEGQLTIFMLVAVIVGIIGAIAPARRASRVDVLEALHEE
jgi:putative ABC transport system permease protein